MMVSSILLGFPQRRSNGKMIRLSLQAWMVIALLSTTLHIPIISATSFPDYQDPFAAGPPFALTESSDQLRNKKTLCRVFLFQNATLRSYNTASRFPYSPGKCQDLPSWDRIILKIRGHVSAGVQYDRAGALWLGGVELARLSTPEPSSARNVSWKVLRDVTMYAPLFSADNRSEVALQIPNVINNVYTGIISLSACLEFHSSADKAVVASKPVPQADYVASLTHPTKHNDAWSFMAIRGNQGKVFNLTIPSALRNATRAHVDLYASAHGCEEFWYTNPPDSIHQQYSMCGGGSTRVIELILDGQVVGIQPPFPVVYTGGMNPLLWRPQTGIFSFNIPPYVFDLTPFLGQLFANDKRPHVMEVKVLSNSATGFWNVDPVLVMFRDETGDRDSTNFHNHPPSRGLDKYEFILQGPTCTMFNSSIHDLDSDMVANVTWVEEFEAHLVAEATSASGTPITLSTSIHSLVTNSLLGENLQVTSMNTQTVMSSSAYNRVERLIYPLEVTSFYKDLNHSFWIDTSITQELVHSMEAFDTLAPSDRAETTPVFEPILYQDEIIASATYSRSTDPDRTVYVQNATSRQSTILFVGQGPCFEQAIAARNGTAQYVHEHLYRNSCVPAVVCSHLDMCNPRIKHSVVDGSRANEALLAKDLLFRHPRCTWTRLRQRQGFRDARSDTARQE